MMAIHQVCHERQLPLDTVLEAVEVALISAFKRKHTGSRSITAQINQKSGEPQIFVEKAIVNVVEDSDNEIAPVDALVLDDNAQIGGLISVASTPQNFGRIAAQTAKQVILQRIREAERDALYRAYADREGEVINGTVHKVDANQVILSLGSVEATLPRSEQIPTERYTEGQKLRGYVSSVARSNRGPQIIISRTHRTMLRRLLEVEVPEIYNGTVEIKSIAREAGYRSKVAVAALQEGVDPVGSCVGMRGTRIQNIVNELGGEKIDVVQWNPDIGYFIANSLSPAKVTNVMLYDEKGKTAVVVVPDKQLSLAIGKEGQNARLAAKLTGWRIDIKSVYEAVIESLEKIKEDESIRDRVAHRMEIFNMGQSIVEEKDPVQYTEPEIKLLSEAIEIVNIAELSIRRERKAKMEQEIKAVRDAGGKVDILVHAEALLIGGQPVTDVPLDSDEAALPDDDSIGLADDELDTAAMALLAAEMGDLDPIATGVRADSTPLDDEDDEVAAEDVSPPERVAEPTSKPERQPKPQEGLDADTILSQAVTMLPDEDKPSKPEPKPQPKPQPAPSSEQTDDDDEFEQNKQKKKARKKKRRLVYDENLGEVVAERRRKRSRRDQNWYDYGEDDE